MFDGEFQSWAVKWILGGIGAITLIFVIVIMMFLAMHYKDEAVYLQNKPPDFYDRMKFKLDRAIMESVDTTSEKY